MEIKSEEGRGTQVSIRLRREEVPKWFVGEIDLRSTAQCIVLDDDPSIHEIWRRRLKSMNEVRPDFKMVHFLEPGAFVDSVLAYESADLERIHLVDFDLGLDGLNGLQLIRQLEIASSSILVTSQSEDLELQMECEKLGLRLLSKSMAALVPLLSS